MLDIAARMGLDMAIDGYNLPSIYVALSVYFGSHIASTIHNALATEGF
jgi:hypothetical protein